MPRVECRGLLFEEGGVALFGRVRITFGNGQMMLVFQLAYLLFALFARRQKRCLQFCQMDLHCLRIAARFWSAWSDLRALTDKDNHHFRTLRKFACTSSRSSLDLDDKSSLQ